MDLMYLKYWSGITLLGMTYTLDRGSGEQAGCSTDHLVKISGASRGRISVIRNISFQSVFTGLQTYRNIKALLAAEQTQVRKRSQIFESFQNMLNDIAALVISTGAGRK